MNLVCVGWGERGRGYSHVVNHRWQDPLVSVFTGGAQAWLLLLLLLRLMRLWFVVRGPTASRPVVAVDL